MPFGRRHRDSFEDLSLFNRFIKAPLGRAFAYLTSFFRSEDDAFEKKSYSRGLIKAISIAANYTIVAPFVFLISGWTTTRQVLPFVLGLPALLVALVAIAPGPIFNYFYNTMRFQYDSLAAKAIMNGKVAEAEVYSQKIFSLAQNDPEYYVRLAEAIGSKLKNREYARNLIEQKAVGPSQRARVAHLWVAQHIINLPGELSEEDIVAAEDHLKQALAVNRSDIPANKLAYDLYMRTNRPEQALTYITETARIEPLAAHLQLQLLKDLNKHTEFESALDDIQARLGELARQNPNELRLWAELAKCCILGERFQEALSIVQGARSLVTIPDLQKDLNVLTSGILVSWFDKAITDGGAGNVSDKTKLQQAIKALNWAIAVFPDNREAVRRASELYLNPNFDSKRLEWAVETMKSDPNAFCTHVFMGWRALFVDKENGVQAARTHWTIANTSSEIANSVIAVLVARIPEFDDSKTDFCVQAVELAMSISPNNEKLATARAMVLMKQAKWEDARRQLADLLAAVNDRRIILNLLITCCNELGDQESAADYQSELDRLNPKGALTAASR